MFELGFKYAWDLTTFNCSESVSGWVIPNLVLWSNILKTTCSSNFKSGIHIHSLTSFILPYLHLTLTSLGFDLDTLKIFMEILRNSVKVFRGVLWFCNNVVRILRTEFRGKQFRAEFHGIPWRIYSRDYFSRNSVEFRVHGFPRNSVNTDFRGIPQYFRGIPQYFHVFRGIPRYFRVSPCWYIYFPRNSMEFHGIPWNSGEFRIQSALGGSRIPQKPSGQVHHIHRLVRPGSDRIWSSGRHGQSHWLPMRRRWK